MKLDFDLTGITSKNICFTNKYFAKLNKEQILDLFKSKKVYLKPEKSDVYFHDSKLSDQEQIIGYVKKTIFEEIEIDINQYQDNE